MPRHDYYEEICLQSTLQTLEQIMGNDKKKLMNSRDYIKSIMDKYNISPTMIVNELMNSDSGNHIASKEQFYAFVSKICGKNSTRNPTPEFVEALYKSITPPRIGAFSFMEWVNFCKIVNYLDEQERFPIYSVEVGKQMLINNSIEKIKEAIHVVKQENILFDLEDISDSDYFVEIPSINLKFFSDNIELFCEWDSIWNDNNVSIWDILKEICEIPSENIPCLKKMFSTINNSITLKTLSYYSNFIKEYLSVRFESCELTADEKRERAKKISSKINPEIEYTIYKILKTINSDLWEIGLLIYLLNNNFSSEKSLPRNKINKKIQDKINKLKPWIKDNTYK